MPVVDKDDIRLAKRYKKDPNPQEFMLAHIHWVENGGRRERNKLQKRPMRRFQALINRGIEIEQIARITGLSSSVVKNTLAGMRTVSEERTWKILNQTSENHITTQ